LMDVFWYKNSVSQNQCFSKTIVCHT
jgi:hypothetical protein